MWRSARRREPGTSTTLDLVCVHHVAWSASGASKRIRRARRTRVRVTVTLAAGGAGTEGHPRGATSVGLAPQADHREVCVQLSHVSYDDSKQQAPVDAACHGSSSTLQGAAPAAAAVAAQPPAPPRPAPPPPPCRTPHRHCLVDMPLIVSNQRCRAGSPWGKLAPAQAQAPAVAAPADDAQHGLPPARTVTGEAAARTRCVTMPWSPAALQGAGCTRD